MVDPDHPWPPKELDRSDEDRLAVRTFVDRVSSKHTLDRFGDIGDFRADLAVSLMRERDSLVNSESWAATEGPAARRAPKLVAFPSYTGAAHFIGRAGELADIDDWCGGVGGPLRVLEAIGGTGKSALAWTWLTGSAVAAAPSWAGRFWWSFYEGSSSVTHFLVEFLAYARPERDTSTLTSSQLITAVEDVLGSTPYLLVLDGVERLTQAYHQLDPSKVTDEDVARSGHNRPNAIVDVAAYDLLTRLSYAGPSRILITTRLTPDALLDLAGRPSPGVTVQKLGGLDPDSTVALVAGLGVTGNPEAVARFFSKLDYHPLVIEIVVGLVNNYRRAPGDFDAWSNDPRQGGSFRLSELEFVHRRAHVVAAALKNLDQGSARVLRYLSALSSAADWSLVQDLNPFLPAKPRRHPPDLSSLGPRPRLTWMPPGPERAAALAERDRWDAQARDLVEAADRAQADALSGWSASRATRLALVELENALRDLEDRGLLWWDRVTNRYDLHPVIRAAAHEGIDADGRLDVSNRIVDHFATWHPPAEVRTVEDLAPAITAFRALVDACDIEAALRGMGGHFFQLLDLGAFSTVVELLEPLGDVPGNWFRQCLIEAYAALGNMTEALAHHEKSVVEALAQRHAISVGIHISNIAHHMSEVGRFARTARALGLLEQLLKATGEDGGDRARISARRAAEALRLGDPDRAAALLAEARALPENPYDRNFASLLDHLDLRLRLRLGTLTFDDLARAEENVRSIYYRLDLLNLRFHLAKRAGKPEIALDAASEAVRLCRDAGCPHSMALVAWASAMLRRPEAAQVLDEARAIEERLEPWWREPGYVADSLVLLGRPDEARAYALDAYRLAWADGPGFHDVDEVAAAVARLEALGETVPDLEPGDAAIFGWEPAFNDFISSFTQFDLAFLRPYIRRAGVDASIAETWPRPAGDWAAWVSAIARTIVGVDGDESAVVATRLLSSLEERVGAVLAATLGEHGHAEFRRLDVLDFETIERLVREGLANPAWANRIGAALSRPGEEVTAALVSVIKQYWLAKHRSHYRRVVASVAAAMAAAIVAELRDPRPADETGAE
ncbi:hypothetical protein [Micromonospora parastrephiae]|uniref:hypothetical protein n=1 Tax=Micromonospora parastrephiae TaxID=2806101 RepID=UPI001EE47EA4|nr:hypothetical protein [Micromonospora parastrephiae]